MRHCLFGASKSPRRDDGHRVGEPVRRLRAAAASTSSRTRIPAASSTRTSAVRYSTVRAAVAAIMPIVPRWCRNAFAPDAARGADPHLVAGHLRLSPRWPKGATSTTGIHSSPAIPIAFIAPACQCAARRCANRIGRWKTGRSASSHGRCGYRVSWAARGGGGPRPRGLGATPPSPRSHGDNGGPC